MKRVNALGGMFMAHGSLPPRERELVILRVAWNTDCDYEYAQHAPIGKRVGLSDEEIRALSKPVGESKWNATDLALIRFTDELTEHSEVTEETWRALAGGHDEDQMIELSLLVGYYQMLAGFLKTTRVPLEDGAEALPSS